jgi:hypothetical protein
MPLFKRLEKKKKFQAREKDRCLLSFGSLSKKRKERKEKEISRINSTLGRGGEGWERWGGGRVVLIHTVRSDGQILLGLCRSCFLLTHTRPS